MCIGDEDQPLLCVACDKSTSEAIVQKKIGLNCDRYDILNRLINKSDSIKKADIFTDKSQLKRGALVSITDKIIIRKLCNSLTHSVVLPIVSKSQYATPLLGQIIFYYDNGREVIGICELGFIAGNYPVQADKLFFNASLNSLLISCITNTAKNEDKIELLSSLNMLFSDNIITDLMRVPVQALQHSQSDKNKSEKATNPNKVDDNQKPRDVRTFR